MKRIIYALPLALCSCAMFNNPYEPPNSELIVDRQIRGMSRNEVIMAINECEANRTRAVVIMAKQKVSGRTTDVVTDVTCAPKYTY